MANWVISACFLHQMNWYIYMCVYIHTSQIVCTETYQSKNILQTGRISFEWCFVNSMGPNSLPAGQADPAERLGFGCAMVSMLLIVLLFPLCFRSDTSVCSWCNSQGMLTVFHKLTYGWSQTQWLMHGHCRPGFWTRNRKVSNQWCYFSSDRLPGSLGLGYLVRPGAWFTLARLTVLLV